jgi:hypothetical protein
MNVKLPGMKGVRGLWKNDFLMCEPAGEGDGGAVRAASCPAALLGCKVIVGRDRAGGLGSAALGWRGDCCALP